MEKRYSLVLVGLLCIVRIGLGQTTMPLSKPPLDRLVNGTQSTLSSIVDNTNYSSSAPEFNSRPEYINFIDPSPSSAGKYIPMKIKILDGPDDDLFGTTLTHLRLTVEDLSSTNQIAMIKTAVITSIGGTVIATATKIGNELVFDGMSGPSVTAEDGDSNGKILHLRVAFDETQVIDNTKLIFKITAATSDPNGSSFSDIDAGGAQSDEGNNNRNRLNVTADRLHFLTQPSDAPVGFNMIPPPTIGLTDLYGNIDLDLNTGSIALTSSGIPHQQPSATLVNGQSIFNTIEHTTSGGPFTLTASYSGWTVISNSFYIQNTAINTYRTTGSGNWLNNTATPSIWERYNGLGWVASNSPSYNSTDTIFIQNGHSITSNGSFGDNISLNVFKGGTFNVNHSGSLGNLNIHSGGHVHINENLSINPLGSLVVQDHGNLTINFKLLDPINSLWAGTENFHSASNLILKNWSGSHALLPNNTSIKANTYGTYTAVFGNIICDFEENLITNEGFDFLASGVHLNLAHGNLIFKSNTTLNADLRISAEGTITSGIGGDFHIENTFTEGQKIIFNTSGILDFFIKGNMKLDAGKILIADGTNPNSNVTIEGDLIIGPTATVDFKSTISTNATATLNLSGDLTVSESGLLQNSNSNGNGILNFAGNGDHSPQLIDSASNHPDENRYINFNIKDNASVKLINRDFELGRNSRLTVETGGVLDFGFNGATALNVILSDTQVGGKFSSEQGSTLIITSPDGISNIANIGNVKTASSNKNFNQTATFYYMGKQNQVTGSALSTGSTVKNIYVILENDLLELRLTNRTGISDGGKLEIHRGIVIGEEAGTNDRDFYGPNGQLIMTGGEYRISTITNNPQTDYLPQLRNYANYSLSGGTIHLNGNNAIQILSGIPVYKNLMFSGNNDFSTSPELYNFKGISKAVSITDNVTISDNAILDVQNKTFGGATTNLIMTDKSRYVTAGTGTKPDATGSYSLGPHTTIEFSSTTGLEEIRITNPVPSYANIIVSGSNVGTQSLGSGFNSFIQFQPNGSFTVKETGTFKLKNSNGFSGANNTAIHNSNNPAIFLEKHSTIEYSGIDQKISAFTPEYRNLRISGTGTKTLGHPTDIFVSENLNIQSSTLLVKTQESITVAESVNVDDSAQFNIENSGSLIQIDDTKMNTGKISMIRKASVKHHDYVYWSSPISGFNVSGISTTNHIYKWDPTVINTNNTHGNWIGAPNEMMNPGKGYIVRAPNGHPTPATHNDLNFTATFYSPEAGLGVPNNGEISVEIKRGSNALSDHHTDDNWNLLGNPYPSAISAIDFLVQNPSIDGYVNLWKHGLPLDSSISPFYQNFNLNYHQADYFTYNSTGNSDGPSSFTGYIAAGQGFMVNMVDGPDQASATVFFRNNMRDKGHSNDQFFRLPETLNKTEEKHRIWLDLISPKMPTKRTLVGYIDGATMDKDRLFDAQINFDDTTEGVYTLINDKPYIIQGRSLPFHDVDVIPLGFKVTQKENYTIAIGAVDGLFLSSDQIIYLKDHVLGFIHNLSNQPYSFNSEAGTFNNRFEIVFNNQALSLNDRNLDSNYLSITELNNGQIQFTVNNDLRIASIEIIDVLGRSLIYMKGKNATEVYDLSNISQATYIAKVTLANGQIITKRFIKNH